MNSKNNFRRGLFAILKINLIDKSFDYTPITEEVYSWSVYLEDMKIWVHVGTREQFAKKTNLFFYIRKNGKIIWEFEMPCKPMVDLAYLSDHGNIFSVSDDQFLFFMSKGLYLCNIAKQEIKELVFHAGLYNVFYDKTNGFIIPVYLMGATKEMFTLDDFE